MSDTWNNEWANIITTTSSNTITYNPQDLSGLAVPRHILWNDAKLLPTPPRFKTVEEANAWLIKNSASPE